MKAYSEKEIIYEKQTEYGLIRVIDTVYEDEPVCFLYVDGACESSMYLKEDKRDELVFPYMRLFSFAFENNPDIRHTFLIGGGGFDYPKFYLRNYDRHKDITVAEISADIIDTAHRYFGLNELNIEDYARLHIINSDGFSWLADNENQYDLIINDAFLGFQTRGRGMYETKIIHKRLSDKGIYIVNVTGARRGIYALPVRRYIEMVKKIFHYTVLMTVDEEQNPYEKQNLLLFASDTPLL